MNAMNYILAALAAIAVVALILRYRGREREFRLMREGFTAEGTVTHVTHVSVRMGSNRNWVVEARFTFKGQRYRAMSGLLPYRPYCEPGQTIRVHFLPENPRYNRILEGDVPGRMEIKRSL